MKKSMKEIKIGDKIGNLTVIEFSHKDKWNKSYYKCLCDCGKTIISRDTSLKFHKNHSCGCLKHYKHNMTHTRLYSIWNNLKRRCYTKSSSHYSTYGGRGIIVCKEWKDNFKNFYEWSIINGYKDDLTLDRINVNGFYSPENCRWTDFHEQAVNQRVRKDNKTGYTGVYLKNLKFASEITVYGKKIYLGCFNTVKEAVGMRNKYIKENGLKEYKIQEVNK